MPVTHMEDEAELRRPLLHRSSLPPAPALPAEVLVEHAKPLAHPVNFCLIFRAIQWRKQGECAVVVQARNETCRDVMLTLQSVRHGADLRVVRRGNEVELKYPGGLVEGSLIDFGERHGRTMACTTWGNAQGHKVIRMTFAV